MLSKIITSIVVPFILFLGVAAANLETWMHAQLWVIFGIVVVAGLLQPRYKPIDTDVPAEDKGTATQIVWSVYFSLIFSVVEAAYFRFPESFVWDHYTTAGLIVALLGLGLRSWAFIELGRHFTLHITVFDDHKVITTGPYRFVRHPGYTGAWMLYSAVPFMLHAWLGVGVAIVLQLVAYSRRINYEEAALRGKLGDAYASYGRSVKTLIPYVW